MSFFYTPTFTYYKIAKIQNLHKQGLNSFKSTEKTPPKHRIAGEPSGITLTRGSAWTSRTTVTGGAWVHAPRPMKTSNLVAQDRLLLLFPSVPAVHLLVTCTRSKNTQTQQMAADFNLFFFIDLFSGLFLICFAANWFTCSSSSPLYHVLATRSAGGQSSGLHCGEYWVSSSSPLLRVPARAALLEEEGLKVRSSGERGAVVDSPYLARRKEI